MNSNDFYLGWDREGRAIPSLDFQKAQTNFYRREGVPFTPPSWWSNPIAFAYDGSRSPANLHVKAFDSAPEGNGIRARSTKVTGYIGNGLDAQDQERYEELIADSHRDQGEDDVARGMDELRTMLFDEDDNHEPLAETSVDPCERLNAIYKSMHAKVIPVPSGRPVEPEVDSRANDRRGRANDSARLSDLERMELQSYIGAGGNFYSGRK